MAKNNLVEMCYSMIKAKSKNKILFGEADKDLLYDLCLKALNDVYIYFRYMRKKFIRKSIVHESILLVNEYANEMGYSIDNELANKYVSYMLDELKGEN